MLSEKKKKKPKKLIKASSLFASSSTKKHDSIQQSLTKTIELDSSRASLLKDIDNNQADETTQENNISKLINEPHEKTEEEIFEDDDLDIEPESLMANLQQINNAFMIKEERKVAFDNDDS